MKHINEKDEVSRKGVATLFGKFHRQENADEVSELEAHQNTDTHTHNNQIYR